MKYAFLALLVPIFGISQSSSITIDTIGFTSRLNFDGPSYNILLGQDVGNINSTGLYNTLIGWENGRQNTTGQRNVSLGSYAGRNNTSGNSNVNVGLTSGTNNTTGHGNVNLGDGAGVLDDDGDYNVRIGYNAGGNAIGSNNVLLGNHAGFSLNADNKLIIANSNLGLPLIYGEFDNKVLEVNGKVNVKGPLSIENTSQPDNQIPAGTIRWNPNSEDFEGYTGTKWKSLTDKDEKKLYGQPIEAVETDILTEDLSESNTVEISDEYLFVGKPNPFGGNGGYVNVYKIQDHELIFKAQLQDVSHIGGEKYGASIDVKDSLLIIGAPEDMNGAAYIYRVSNGIWNLEQKILSSSAGTDDFFGKDVAIHDNWAVVGAPFYDTTGVANRGAAYVFNWNGSSWLETQKLKEKFAFFSDELGHSVDIEGSVIVVGQPYNNQPFGAGRVYSFKLINGIWTREQNEGFTPNGFSAGDKFGIDISLDNSRLVVGAISRDDSGSNAGAAFVYNRVANGFIETFKILPRTIGDEINFGQSVSIKGDFLTIGGPGANSNTGYSEVHQFINNSWKVAGVATSTKMATGTNFGISVAVNDKFLVIGSSQLNASIFVK